MLVVTVLASLGCVSALKPTRPDAPLFGGARVDGVRFESTAIAFREPGVPVSPSRAWQREVAGFTATQLNTALNATDDAPVARTIVTFDLASPSVIQIGPWKEITITVASTLPDGTVVKTGPLDGRIDDGVEAGLLMGLNGTVFVVDAASSIVAITALIFFQGSPALEFGILAGAIVVPLLLHGGQKGAEALVASSEETRWSNFYVDVLRQHAEAVRTAYAGGPHPVRIVPEASQLPQPPPRIEAPLPTPAGPVPPPPPALLDPAEAIP